MDTGELWTLSFRCSRRYSTAYRETDQSASVIIISYQANMEIKPL